jgi:S1-C subfamily serine protease
MATASHGVAIRLASYASIVPRNIYGYYGPCVAYVEIEKPDGAHDIGCAFHVGDGVFVTARHVVADNKVLSVATTMDVLVELDDGKPSGHLRKKHKRYRIKRTTPRKMIISDTVDVAAMKLRLPHPEFNEIYVAPSSGKRWMDELVLEEAVVLGFPRIPSAHDSILVGLRCDVSAVVRKRTLDSEHAHFVLSSMARGGFGGGPVFNAENGYLIGLVSEALLRDSRLPPELGYMAVVPTDIIRAFLDEKGWLPERSEWAMYGL